MSLNQLGIWRNDKAYLCDVNEHTTCDEVMQLFSKTPVNDISHPFEPNACEYKLDKLFAKQSDSSNNIGNGSMDENRQGYMPRKSRLDILYDSRIQELSQRIALLDSTIEIYDNTDGEDDLSDDEITENQITRMGILLKKQSITIKNLSSQQSTCLYTEEITRERLLRELEKNYSQLKALDDELNQVHSTLDILNCRSDKCVINTVRHPNMSRTTSQHSRRLLTRNQFPANYERDKSVDLALLKHTQCKAEYGQCTANEYPAPGQDIYMPQDKQHCIDVIDGKQNYSYPDIRDNVNEKEILTRREIMSLTFGLKDEESSVLV